MKIDIKNLLFQPLALHLATDGEGLHLSARECREILTEHVSEEIQLAAARGLVSLINKIDHAPDNETIEGASVGTSTADKSNAGQRKGSRK